MSGPKIRVAEALDVLASIEDGACLVSGLIGASYEDPSRAGASSERYGTLETRVADADALEAEIPRLLAQESARREKVWREVIAALRAVGEGDPAGAARRMVAAGEVEEGAGRLEAAARLYRRAVDLGRKPRDRRGEGLALRRLGRVEKARGRLDEALRHYRHGYEIAEAEGDEDGVVVACQGIGNTHVDRGRWSDAEEWYGRGLRCLGEDVRRERWQLESNLSVVARRRGRLDESEAWLKAARATATALDDAEAGVYLDNAEGLLRVAQGRLPEAERLYRSAMEAAMGPAARATALINLAECLLLQGRITDSVEAARELERLVLAADLHPFLLYVYLALGAAGRARKDPDALVFFEQALELASAAGNDGEVAQVQREYAGWEAEQGAIESAIARLHDAASLFERAGSELDAVETRQELGRLESGPG